MPVNTLLVRSYSTNVYLTGMNSLTNINATRPQYVAPVMQYAASNYYIEDIDSSLTKGFITAQEHADTQALKTENDPQHRPEILLMAQEEMM